MKRYVLLCSTLLLAASSVLNGGSKQIASAVPAFAQAVALTATNVQAAFDTVQSTFCDAQALSFEVKFTGGADSDPSNICKVTWLPPASMAARTQILQGLKQYASELTGVSAPNVSGLDSATTALGKNLNALTTSDAFTLMSKQAQANLKAAQPNITLAENFFSTAVNALGKWFIERKVAKVLPGEIKDMEPNIQAIKELLIADIGVVGADPKIPEKGSGLRQELWIQYGKEITSWNLYVSTNYYKDGKVMPGVSPDAALAAVKQLASLVNQRRTADQVLAQVAETVNQMAQAHTKLVAATNEKQGLIADFSDLLAEAQRLNTYYQSLATSK
jgi:hypothetical protein